MEITEVRIKLMEDQQERLLAFCSITFDHCFVVRDLKIIEGAKGAFVAMPSRKLTDRCCACHCKNHLRALYCNHCGATLAENRAPTADDGRAKLYADISHPINSRCRDMIQARVLQAYDEEVIKAQQPGYICTYDDYGDEGDDFGPHDIIEPIVITRAGTNRDTIPMASYRSLITPASRGHRREYQQEDTPFGAGILETA